MCGIVGIYYFDRNHPVNPERFIRQNDALAHRGPDDGGVFIEPGVALGHRRLSIIDLDGGRQPMWDVEGRIGIVFNGEIYNYRELQRELEGYGHRFVTSSDTEVIIHAFRQWGERAVDRFRGMFAFAIFDRKNRTMFLARDRLGKKPLYYYADRERFMFASELKALLADPSVPREVEPTAVVDYFAYGYVPGPGTILRNFRKLPAGHMLFVDPRGVTEETYWDLDFSKVDPSRTLSRSAEDLARELEDAVRLRLRADVPLGAFLSGGVDSSLVVSLMARASERRILTHTIGFSESGYDEREYARETAELWETDHSERVVRVEDSEILDRLSFYFDEPFGDASAIPTYLLSASTREKVTVALSGDGGDESFAGYRRHLFAMAEYRIRNRLPPFFRGAVIAPLARAYPKADYLPQPLRARATLTNLAASQERAYFLSLSQKTYPRVLSSELLDVTRDHDPFVHFERHFSRAQTQDPLARLLYVDIKTSLVDDILVKVDRASMAHGLEVRVPLLDQEVVELAARMPSNQKLRGQESKIVLKKVAAGLLPENILKREKKGFTVPLPEWFRGGLRARAESLLFDQPGGSSGLFDARGLRRMWYEHQLGFSDHSRVLWSLVMFESWARRFLGKRIDVERAPRGAQATRVMPSAGAPT